MIWTITNIFSDDFIFTEIIDHDHHAYWFFSYRGVDLDLSVSFIIHEKICRLRNFSDAYERNRRKKETKRRQWLGSDKSFRTHTKRWTNWYRIVKWTEFFLSCSDTLCSTSFHRSVQSLRDYQFFLEKFAPSTSIRRFPSSKIHGPHSSATDITARIICYPLRSVLICFCLRHFICPLS